MMADQAKITDFFQTTRRPVRALPQSAKRKAVDVLEEPPVKRVQTEKLQQQLPVTPVTPVKQEQPAGPSKFVLSPLKFDLSEPILTSPRKATLPSPVRSKTWASQRLKLLADDDHDVSCLPLPKKYKLLADTFVCMDRVVSLIMRQKQMTSFERISKSVELMSRRRFDMKKLLQLKSISPDAFILKYGSSVSGNQQTSQLTTTLLIVPTKRMDSGLTPIELKPAVCSARKQEFLEKLIDITKEHHQKFVHSLALPFTVDNKKLIKWHPNFKLDDVPDIATDTSLMPVNPHTKSEQTVDIVLQRIRGNVSSPDGAAVPAPTPQPKLGNGKIKNGVFQGLDVAFVERIRAKEAAKIAKELTRSPEVEKKISLLQESSSLIRTVRSCFVGEGKTVLSKESVIHKIITSSSSYISDEEVEERVTFLTNVLPDWITILQIRKGSYIKILNINQKLTDLEKRIDDKIISLREA